MKKNTFVFYVISTCILLGIMIISYNIENFSPITLNMSESQIIAAVQDDIDKAKSVKREAIIKGILVNDEDFDEVEDLVRMALEQEELVKEAQKEHDDKNRELATEKLKALLPRLIKADELLNAQITLLQSEIRRVEEAIRSKKTGDDVSFFSNLAVAYGIGKIGAGIIASLAVAGQVAAAVAMGL